MHPNLQHPNAKFQTTIIYKMSGVLTGTLPNVFTSQWLCDCPLDYPPAKHVPVRIKRQRGGRPSPNWRSFVAFDWTWKSNDITNKSCQLSDKEPLQSRSGERSRSLTVVTRLACKSECFDNVMKLINLV